MKILVTGVSGLVGAALARAAFRRGHEVIGIVGHFTGELPGVTERCSLDLTDPDSLTATVLDRFPDAIVNCAAISEPAVVDADPVRAQALNVALPTTLARLANHLNARCLHISSEQVFDGTKRTPYAVGDPTSPINLYGRQKLESEQAVHTAAPTLAATVRAPLLMGNSPGGRRSTHERLFSEWAAGKTSQLYEDEFRQPCTAENLAEVLLELCERRDLCGVFQWAGAELLSRHALGLAVRTHFKLSPKRAPIVAVNRAARPEIAKGRQAYLALDISPLAGKLKTRPQSVADQLAELHVPPATRAWYFSRSTFLRREKREG